eukprot:7391711-Prymnesium_polylepis.1
MAARGPVVRKRLSQVVVASAASGAHHIALVDAQFLTSLVHCAFKVILGPRRFDCLVVCVALHSRRYFARTVDEKELLGEDKLEPLIHAHRIVSTALVAPEKLQNSLR